MMPYAKARALASESEFQSTPDYADAYLGWAETVPHPSHELFWRTVTYQRALHNHENKEQQ